MLVLNSTLLFVLSSVSIQNVLSRIKMEFPTSINLVKALPHRRAKAHTAHESRSVKADINLSITNVLQC